MGRNRDSDRAGAESGTHRARLLAIQGPTGFSGCCKRPGLIPELFDKDGYFPMDFWALYLLALGVILALMTKQWVISLHLTNASIVDIFWGFGFAVCAAVYFAFGGGAPDRKLLLLALVALWGLRLSGHIGWRNIGKPEDFRYQAWRRQHGSRWWWVSLFQVFVLQGLIMWLISSTLLLGMSGTASLGWLDAVAALVFAIGFLFEAVGDWQLAQFKADPANQGKVMDRGLWRYTRHPNYFGDATVWWAFGLIALGAPNGVFGLIGPAIMTFLLARVSGVTLLEQAMGKRPGYREYAERTSAFFPLPPKR